MHFVSYMYLWLYRRIERASCKPYIRIILLSFIYQNSAKIIRSSVFGLDDKLKVREKFVFPANNLTITSVDIQSVEPVDQRTRDALQKSVQLAIEITTASQEASARYVLVDKWKFLKLSLIRQLRKPIKIYDVLNVKSDFSETWSHLGHTVYHEPT